MARKRSTSTDPAALEQAQATQETKSGLSSNEGRKKSTDATRMAGQKSTRKRTSSRVKADATIPAAVAGAASHPQESTLVEASPEQSFRRARPEPPMTGQDDLSSEVSIRERIALLAYSYWEARGRQGGSPEEDWLRAESEVLNRLPDTGQ
jgi:hypothetical protein